MRRLLVMGAAVLLMAQGVAATDYPIEIGAVTWGRDLSKAQEASAETGRPIFVLFQEVPGCSGCQEFGRKVLSDPLIVEAVEDEFIPVLVFNNRGGMDRELLERFDEPAWNYQVVRFLDAQGEDIIPRRDRIWTIRAIATRMIAALRGADREVPHYLVALAEEARIETAGRKRLTGRWRGIYDLPGLTATQKARIEANWDADGDKALEWLSPRQRQALMARVKK